MATEMQMPQADMEACVWPCENVKELQLLEVKSIEISAEDAIRQYGLKFGKQSEEDSISFDRKAFPWGGLVKDAQERVQPCAEDVKSAFDRDLEAVSTDISLEEDSDGEEVVLCKKCHLPVGEIRYTEEDGEKCLHGECMAQVMLSEMRRKEEQNAEDDRKERNERREAYGIGWKTEYIPRNDASVSKLAMQDIPQGMVCLVYNEHSNTVSLASTLEPAAAVNLEYLSTTLQVRRTEGHEPVFSLDPVDPDDRDDKHAMQEKVFVPEWLADTAVGDVLFQADYHLKELSMGQHEQPVIGMKSCFDISDMEDTDADDWSAREWFLVRKAEMKITESNALIPYVKMGVEAREQVMQGNSLLDKPVTRPDHPMVQYAEAFSKNFDLIAERKSVVFHLRELAKTSVMSKYLLDAGVNVEESWFHLSNTKRNSDGLLVPQTWNHKLFARLEMNEKTIESSKDGKSHTHGVYGGVNFGLDKFNLTSSVAGRHGSAAGLKASVAPAKKLSAVGPQGRLGALAIPGGAQKATAAPQSALAALKPAAGVQLTAPTVGKASALVPAAKSTPSLVGSVRQLAAVQGLLSRTQAASGAPLSLTAYGRQFAPPGMGSVTAPKMPHFSPPNASLGAVGAPRLAASGILTNAALAAPRLASQITPPSMSLVASNMMGSMIPPSPNLQGVDLRLDNFDLSSATRVSSQKDGSDVRALDKCMAVGDAFWSSLDGKSKNAFSDDDYALLRQVFNPALSDRREEKDLFCPPDTSHAYIQKLRDLVTVEETLCEQRKERFFDQMFKMSEPGNLFPSSWTSTLEVSRASGRVSQDAMPRHALVARPEYKEHASELVNSDLPAPVFDKTSEDGMCFRIYRMGNLEIRTTQALDASEAVGAVFALCSTSSASASDVSESGFAGENIIHASEFVECAFANAGNCKHRYYVVFETENGHSIVTERLPNGAVTWQEDPAELEDRNSLAKVTRAAACPPGVLVRDLKAYQTTIARGAERSGVASSSVCKRYARSAYSRVAGAQSISGFRSAPWWMDVAKAKMATKTGEEATKKDSFIALPRTMLKTV